MSGDGNRHLHKQGERSGVCGSRCSMGRGGREDKLLSPVNRPARLLLKQFWIFDRRTNVRVYVIGSLLSPGYCRDDSLAENPLTGRRRCRGPNHTPRCYTSAASATCSDHPRPRAFVAHAANQPHHHQQSFCIRHTSRALTREELLRGHVWWAATVCTNQYLTDHI